MWQSWSGGDIIAVIGFLEEKGAGEKAHEPDTNGEGRGGQTTHDPLAVERDFDSARLTRN